MYGGQTDLADFYRDRLTLRQVYYRILALPTSTRTWALIEAERQRAAEHRAADEVEQALAPFTR